MEAFLVCEDETLGRSIQQVLLRERVECPISSVISFGQAVRKLVGNPVDLIVAVLPDDPLRSVEALEFLATVPRGERTVVIAIGPAADAKLVIRALRGVVDDYVDVHELESELISALAGWRRKWSLDRAEGRLIAVLAPSGGAGSSTVAANLAVLLAKQAGSAALVDLKLETGDLASLLDLKPTYSLADLCKNIDRLDEVLLRKTLVEHASGVQLLAPPRSLSDVDSISPEGVRQSIALARASFPSVVVDLDHHFGQSPMDVLRKADEILVVLRPDFTSLKNAARFLDHLDGLGILLDRVKVIVNRLGQPKEVPIAKVEEAMKLKVFLAIPEEMKVVNRANNNGVPVVIEAPSSRFAKALLKLAKAVQPETLAAPAKGSALTGLFRRVDISQAVALPAARKPGLVGSSGRVAGHLSF